MVDSKPDFAKLRCFPGLDLGVGGLCPAPVERKAVQVADPVKKMEEPEPTPSLPTPGAEPPGPTDELAPDIQLADSCFARAEQATVRGNFEYAIHLYLDGLRYNPRDLEHGHKGLHDCAIRRRNTGKGGGIGALFGQAKTGLSQMLGRQKDAMRASWRRWPATRRT